MDEESETRNEEISMLKSLCRPLFNLIDALPPSEEKSLAFEHLHAVYFHASTAILLEQSRKELDRRVELHRAQAERERA